MEHANDFGSRIIANLSEKRIFIKDFLVELKNKYPDERGLTENGFRYSLKNGTMKVKTLQKVSEALDVTVDHWFKEKDALGMEKYEKEIDALEARIEELEQDKENLQDLVKVLKETESFRKQSRQSK